MAESTVTGAAHGDANYKETIESILIAFILAFIFRAFVVEAYVIPTGSMAPTLYGAHTRFKCPDCGYTFDGGTKGENNAAGDDLDFPSEMKPAVDFHCPNCGYAMSPTDKQPVRFGDRILVLKYLYLFQKPIPGDVVVFKSPDEQSKHVPEDPEYGTNYIKRLIGVGPESIVILDGDVYTGAFGADKPLGADGKPLFKIQRKPAHVQDALWRVIFNTDFIPHLGSDTHFWQQPWEEETPSSGWRTHGAVSTMWPRGAPSRIFEFSNKGAGGAIVFDPDVNPETHALTDFLVYDEAEHRDPHQGWQPLFVSDLRLAADYIRKSGDGPLRMQLSKNADLFTAEISPGKVRLLRGQRVGPNNPRNMNQAELQSVEVPGLGSAPVRIELSNVDYRVSVRVDGREVLATTDAQYAPNVADLWKKEDPDTSPSDQGPFGRPLVRIEAQRQENQLEHVILSRDIYYLTRRGTAFWATTRDITHLKEGEYFVMGDNSFISGDARYWRSPIDLPRENLEVESGRVPERFMLGKAFFVYWPAGYRLQFLPVNAVPDFGEMRFIK